MRYVKRKLSDDRFIITGQRDKNAAVKIVGDEARILFSEDDPELLKMAENEACSMGCRKAVCDYYSAFEMFGSFLSDSGYDSSKTKKIIGVNIRDIFASKAVKKSLTIDFPDTDFIPFEELLLYQLEELMELIDKAGIPLSREDVGELDQALSGIAYDKNRKIQAFILVSARSEDIVVECLYGVSKNNPKYIMTALQGFGKEIIRCGMTDMYEKVTMLEYNDTIRPLVLRLLDGKFKLLEIGDVIHAEKLLDSGKDDGKKPEARDDRTAIFEAKKIYDTEILRRPYQGNINWKAEWNLNKDQ